MDRLLMVALDAAEPRLIERWIEDGALPNLVALRERGAYGRLESTADWLAGSPWPSFYTGTTPAEHGIYHVLQWRSDRMAMARPTPDWLPARPFWRHLGGRGTRAVAIDLPMTFAPEPFEGVEVSGWATHDRLAQPASHPPSLMRRVRREFGSSPLQEEVYGPQRPGALLALGQDLVRATEGVADLAEALIRREPWTLFLVGFGATHRGGHKLWDFSGVAGEVGTAESPELSRALRDVYAACDRAVARLVRAAGEGVATCVFSLHGMGPNTSRAELLPEMLSRILTAQASPTRETGAADVLRRVRGLLPLELRHAVKRRLPVALQDRLTTFWRTGRVRWEATRAFPLLADLQGYVRINLRGREAAGVVEPGEDYERLCGEIVEGLRSFRQAESGDPVVSESIRSSHLFPEGARRSDLPDLLVRWSGRPAAEQRAIISPRYGSIPWPSPGRNPDGRSGNHRPQGFLLAVGEGIQAASILEGGHILDLAPTVCARLAVPPPWPMAGKALSGLA